MAKLPGKTAYSGTRRPMTRTAGFSSHSETTGGEWNTENSTTINLPKGSELSIDFAIPEHIPGRWIAFGGWLQANDAAKFSIKCDAEKYTLTEPSTPNWSKFGSMWQGNGTATTATIHIYAKEDTKIHYYKLECGVSISPGAHSNGEFIECDQASYLTNMHMLSPEAHFWITSGKVTFMLSGSDVNPKLFDAEGVLVYVKSCNRCGRFLPININNERLTLSFSNHCIANHPCKHSTFGRLKNVLTGEQKHLEYGFQLECRYCKKYCVNWAHNKQRSPSQMKEDGARRRFFEVLIAELFQQSKQLKFKQDTGIELADYVWEKFSRKCFACDTPLSSSKEMHLDHTRPLVLLWPLDDTATALCGSCNSSKSDKNPAEFYEKPGQLKKLSQITGIPLSELETPGPNMKVISELLLRLDWFFNEFLTRAELARELDGKVASELVVKSIQKAISRSNLTLNIDLEAEYKKRRGD